MIKLALLTCRNWPGALESEQAFAKEFPPHFQVRAEVWNDPAVDWSGYDYLIFRTVWDYFNYPVEFAAWLAKIELLGVKTLNPLGVIKRNQHKFYLRELQGLGINIIPTVFIPKHTGLDLSFLNEKGWSKAVIKPAISAAAYATTLFTQEEIGKVTSDYATMAIERDLLVQPFMPEIQSMGEVSVLFFGGQFSHAILKKPKPLEFRVQSQYGGDYQVYHPTNEVIETAARIVAAFGADLLYARVDGVLRDGIFFLMEVELIEPDLYFGQVPAAKGRFLAALERIVCL